MTFGEKIKAIRLKMFLSQEKFAKEIGVSFATINRWERGLNEPNYEGQKAIYEFCKRIILKLTISLLIMSNIFDKHNV